MKSTHHILLIIGILAIPAVRLCGMNDSEWQMQLKVDRLQQQMNDIEIQKTKDANEARNGPAIAAARAKYAARQAELKRWVAPIVGFGGEIKNASEIPIEFREKVARERGKTVEQLFGHLNKPAQSNVVATPKVVIERPSLATSTEPDKQSYDKIFSDSLSNARSLYGFMSNPDSLEYRRAIEINDTLKEAGDPLVGDPNKPLIIAQMVAKELRIAPKKQSE